MKSQVWIQALTVQRQNNQTITLYFDRVRWFSICLYSIESAIGLVLTLAEQGVHHTGLESESSFTMCSHHLQFYSHFSLSLSSSLQCFLSAPRVQIERQLVRLVYLARCIPFANVLKLKIFLNNCFIV